MKALEKPVLLGNRTLFRSRLFQLEQLELRFANGNQVSYERINDQGRGAVLVVPLLDDDTVLLVREYAAGVERYEISFPKGRIDQGEAPEAAANREIMEEIGYGAATLVPLTVLTLAPGYIRHNTHIILARDLYPHKLDGDEPEELEIIPWRIDQLDTLLAREDFTEARSVAALYLAREHLRQ